ncbi:MAG: HAD family hydrolase, partial [Elusimicrobiota bacterium]|nr:HAD family hydrolase [Elusimicrobiota bacterium]
LKEQGKEVCLISGDNNLALQAVAARAGIEEYYGDMLPQDKAAKIAAQNNIGGETVMIGDGFNDILALLQAGAGISFAAGQNAFNSWADIAVSSKDFGSVKKIFLYDRRRQNIIRQNILIGAAFGLTAVYFALNHAPGVCRLGGLLLAPVILITINSARLK